MLRNKNEIRPLDPERCPPIMRLEMRVNNRILASFLLNVPASSPTVAPDKHLHSFLNPCVKRHFSCLLQLNLFTCYSIIEKRFKIPKSVIDLAFGSKNDRMMALEERERGEEVRVPI